MVEFDEARRRIEPIEAPLIEDFNLTIEPGQRVVTSAQYLLDSESNLGEVMRSMMATMNMSDMGGMRIYTSMLMQNPDVFIHNGDNIYADGPLEDVVGVADGSVWRNAFLDRVPSKRKVCETLAEFQAAYEIGKAPAVLTEKYALVVEAMHAGIRAAQPGVPNFFGLVGAEANAVAPGKRPLSSMSPTIVLKRGQPILSLGAAGFVRKPFEAAQLESVIKPGHGASGDSRLAELDPHRCNRLQSRHRT